MKKVNEMSHNELIEEVEKLRDERNLYKSLNHTHVEKLNQLSHEMEKVNILTHEVDHYKGLTDYYTKFVDTQMERIQEFTELISTLKMQRDELEKDNELLKEKLGFSSDYLLKLMELKERQIEELREENYKIKNRCNDLDYGIEDLRIHCDSTLCEEREQASKK